MSENNLPTSPNFVNYAGRRVGGVDVEQFLCVCNGLSNWLCRCVTCGRQKIMHSRTLGKPPKSCGCVNKVWESNKTHGKCYTRTYRIWIGMRGRCKNQRACQYKDYGGRGIRVCSRWDKSFPAFLADIGESPNDLFSLERIDNDGNYSCGHCPECKRNGWPANCRWATDREQCSNTRFNHHITIGEETHTLSQWARILGMSRDTLWNRVRMGWPSERLGEPVSKRRPWSERRHEEQRNNPTYGHHKKKPHADLFDRHEG